MLGGGGLKLIGAIDRLARLVSGNAVEKWAFSCEQVFFEDFVMFIVYASKEEAK